MHLFPAFPPVMLESAPQPVPAPKLYRPSVAGALARVAVTLVSFVLVGLLLRALAAPAGGSVIGGKLEYWRAHAHEYDTVFLGSSHVFRAFVPAEFDRDTAGFGVATKSFNFGVQAVQLLEQRHLLHAILDARPELERVFFEYQWLFPQVDPQNAFSPRTVYWHDPETTRLAATRALHWGAELGDDFAFVEDESQRHSVFTALERVLPPGTRAAEEHVQHGLTELLLIGRGKDVLRGLLGRSHGQTARYREQHGYLSLEDDERMLAAQGEAQNSYRARRERFLANLEAYRRDVDVLDAAEVSFGDGEWINAELTRVDDFELIAGIAREVQARGVEFVLVILPSQSANRPFEERLAAELGAPLLRYNQPERYPELYAPRNRWDSGHLSAEGARWFSRVLARDYAGLSGAHEPRATDADRGSLAQ
jgi:hypothetical protein